MRYISGEYALNVPCRLGTSGDWHYHALDWTQVKPRETGTAFFGCYGLEKHTDIPGFDGAILVANHIRACLDLMADSLFSLVQGMRNDFITNESLNEEIFENVMKLRNQINWRDVDRFMEKEYRTAWLEYKGVTKTAIDGETSEIQLDEAAELAHQEIILDFLQFLNKSTRNFVLKGGSALIFVYGIHRYSHDIDLDGGRQRIHPLVQRWANLRGYSVSVKKDTDHVTRFMVNYGGRISLKIEVSYRMVPGSADDRCIVLKGMSVYKIDALAAQKATAYSSRDKIRDLIDLTFISKNYYDDLSPSTKSQIAAALLRKGLDYFDYIVRTQGKEIPNQQSLESDFLLMMEKFDLL